MIQVSRPSIAIVVPQRRGLSAKYIHAALARQPVDQFRRADEGRLHALNSGVPASLAPIALRTIDLAPSQPARYLLAISKALAAGEVARKGNDAVFVLDKFFDLRCG